jgi:small subunit ribosomal protein S29
MGDSKYTALNEEGKLKPVHAHDFVQVRHFIEHLSGERELGNGGMVLAATSLSEHIKSAALDVVIKAAEARQEKGEVKVSDFYDPYQKLDMRALRKLTRDMSSPQTTTTETSSAAKPTETIEATGSSEATTSAESATPSETSETTAITTKRDSEGLGVIRLQGITKPEAKNILEYWATSGMIRRQIEEKFVADQWTISGGGVLRELEKGCLRRAA